MPIKPENAKRYPADWKSIRARILLRAANRCERCGLENYAVILRKPDGTFRHFGVGADYKDARQLAADTHWSLFGDETWPKLTIVVLTIMHLDHIPEHCEDSNLQAACQRCHLVYDVQHHQHSARQTRLEKAAPMPLFPEAP